MTSNNISVAEFITKKVENAPITQSEIAKKLGWANPNVITMIKKGRTKVPLAKIKELAEAVEMDPVALLRIVLMEYQPDIWAVLERLMGEVLVTKTEMSILNIVREAAGGVEIAPVGDEQKEELKALALKWKDSIPKVIKHH